MTFDPSELSTQVTEVVSTWGLRVVGAIALLIVGFVVARVVRAMVRSRLRSVGLDAMLVPFVANLCYYAVITFVMIAFLRLFGIETASFVAVLGAAGLAIGLALQGTLSNFASGVMLLAFRPFKVGDFIEAAGTSGKVLEVGIFATTLSSPDNIKIIAPNSEVYSATIRNYTAFDTRRNDLEVGVAYGDDLEVARATIERVIKGDPRVLAEPAPLIAVSTLGDSSVNFVVRPWCKTSDYWPLRFDLTRTLKEELEGAGCSIPFPQREVTLHKAS